MEDKKLGLEEETELIAEPAEGRLGYGGEKKSPAPLIALVALIVGLVAVAAGGVLAYMGITETGLFQKEDKLEREVSSELPWKVAEYPRVDASTATHPLAIAFYEDFTGDRSKALADFGFTKTHEAYTRLINGDVDLILVTSPSEDELLMAKEKNMELLVTPVVKEGFVFFVSTDNPVDNLTSEQVRDIYAGKITNWKEVGGEDLSIVAYQRQRNSGSQTGMLDLVMKGVPLMTPPSENWQIGTMEAIVDAVSSYKNTSEAIGYSYYFYVTTMYQDIDADVADGIKLLSIDGVKPGEASIQSGKYPFTTAYYIVIDKAVGEDAPARRLMNDMLGTRGQAVARGAEYVPVK
jgi:phosphate transport system substrate-binding protein